MPSADPRWEQMHDMYEYEFAKRTHNLTSTTLNLSAEEQLAASQLFEPGEIAHIRGCGGVNLAFLEFLQGQGYKLSAKERCLKYNMKHTGESIGKYCIVLERLGAGKYIVCYITSFHKIIHGSGLSPTATLFSIAMGDTPPYPPDIKPLRITPSWIGSGFIFGVPVIREGLKKVKYGRYLAHYGELHRLKSLIRERLKVSLVTPAFLRLSQTSQCFSNSSSSKFKRFCERRNPDGSIIYGDPHMGWMQSPTLLARLCHLPQIPQSRAMGVATSPGTRLLLQPKKIRSVEVLGPPESCPWTIIGLKNHGAAHR